MVPTHFLDGIESLSGEALKGGPDRKALTPDFGVLPDAGGVPRQRRPRLGQQMLILPATTTTTAATTAAAATTTTTTTTTTNSLGTGMAQIQTPKPWRITAACLLNAGARDALGRTPLHAAVAANRP